MIKLIVMGTSAAIPTKEHPSSCFAVKYGGVYMFDACEGVQRQMMKYGASLMQVKAVFISHLHADHILGLPGMMQTLNLMGRKEDLLIVGPKGVKKMFEAIFSTKELAPKTYQVKFKEVSRASKAYENELFAVTAFPVKHTKGALGFLLSCHSYRRFDVEKAKEAGLHGHLFTFIAEKGVAQVGKKIVKYEDVSYVQPGKSIAYSGDTRPCPGVEKYAKGVDVLVHEATFIESEADDAKAKGHSTAKQAAKIALKAKAKRLLLTHFSNRYDDRSVILAEAKETFDNTELAQEGMEIMV